MKTNPKLKGCQFERDVCKYLNKHTGLTFVRSHLKLGTTAKEMGDIYCDQMKDFVVECKFYKDPLTFSELFNDANRLDKWLNVLLGTKKDFIIFIKTNRAGIIYFVNDISVLIKLNLLEDGYKKLNNLYFNKARGFK